MFSPLVDELMLALRVLPGVGPKTAQRMALYLLERNREGAFALSDALARAARDVKRCRRCRTLTERPECQICQSPRRDTSLLCVVETPGDVLAIEQSGSFQGLYFVLHGRLSPIDGIGPSELGLGELSSRLTGVEELILATNPTMEGEATAYYIAEKARAAGVKVSRIAHGVPMGGELEYVDGGTLTHALNSRREL